jgi:hypothetical protein
MKMRAVVCVILFAGALSADVVFVKSGKVYLGRIKSERSGEIELSRKDKGGLQKIARNEVLRILYKDEIGLKFIYLVNGTQRHAFIVDENARQIVIREQLEVISEETIDRKRILAISEKQLASTSLPFTFHHGVKAERVEIEGEFTAWRPVPLESEKSAPNRWQISLPIDILKKNQYEYRFVVDGNAQEMRSIKFKAENEKLFEDIDSMQWKPSLAVGPGIYSGGYAEQLQIHQPVISFGASFRFSSLPQNVQLRLDTVFFRDHPNAAALPLFSRLEAETLNFGGFLSIGYKFTVFSSFSLTPAIGAGGIFQFSRVTGFRADQVSNQLFAAVTRLTIGYHLTRQLSLILPLTSIAEFDARLTFVSFIAVGVEFAL